MIVPVKPWLLAKSRLVTTRRTALAQAFALDTLDLLGSTPDVGRVVVVSAEPRLAGEARRRGFGLVVDRPLLSQRGLDAAADLGRRWALRESPGDRIVILPADLPCLTPAGLYDVLRSLEHHDEAFVRDLDGDGTTLVSAAEPRQLRSAYGQGSAARHAAQGCTEVLEVPLAARRDVDTLDDLAQAFTMGLPSHGRTRALVGPTSATVAARRPA